MSSVRSSLCAAVLAATLAAAGPVSAEELDAPTTEAVFAAFKAICIDHVGDSDAQIAAGQAAPQGFVFRETDSDGTKVFLKGMIALNVLPKDDQRYCMVISAVDKAPTMAAGTALLAKHLPASARRTPSENDQARWADRHGAVVDSYLFVLPDGGERKIVAFFVGREPANAASD